MNRELAKYIDHTLLKADAMPGDVIRLCAEAREFGFASVCVNGGYVSLAVRELEGTGVATCSVVGFPLGAGASTSKAFEASEAVSHGASEIDMVLAVGRRTAEA